MSDYPSSTMDSDGAGSVLSVKQAAAHLGVSPDTVRAHLRQGTLAGEKIDNKWVVYLDEPHPMSTKRHAGAETAQDRLLAHAPARAQTTPTKMATDSRLTVLTQLMAWARTVVQQVRDRVRQR